jgi:hypothetical protein
MQKLKILCFLFIIPFLLQACQSGHTIIIELESTNNDLKNTPVFMDIDKALLKFDKNYCLQFGSEKIPVQSEEISPTQMRLWWMANLPAGEKRVSQLTDDCPESEAVYTWHNAENQSLHLALNDKLLLGYEFPEFDINNRELTYKPYHHVFDPQKGIHITKGPGGLYSHHRGIYYGYNQIRVDGGDPVDIWHNHNGEHSEHVRSIREFSGPVFGGHTVEIEWRDTNAKTFAGETRTLKVFYEDEKMIIDFHSVLKPVDAEIVELNGDRHHGGVQFRAANEVNENSEATFFTRPLQVQHLSPWSEIEGDEMYDLPWNVMSYFLDDQQYNVAYFSHPSNPTGAEMSERQYGRFGEFFPFTLTSDNPLEVSYRFIITKGQAPAVETLQVQYENFARKINYKIIN